MTYKGIELKAYKADEFKNAFVELKAMRGGLEALAQDSSNPDAVRILGSVIKKKADFFYEAFETPSDAARNIGDQALSAGQEAMGKYVDKNAKKIYDGLDETSVVRLLANSKRVEGSKDKGYNAFVEALSKQRKILEASQDSNKRKEFVAEIMEGKTDSEDSLGEPDWFKQASAAYMGSDRYVNALFAEYAVESQKKVTEILEGTSERNIKKYGKIALDKAKATRDVQFHEMLGEVAYAQMTGRA